MSHQIFLYGMILLPGPNQACGPKALEQAITVIKALDESKHPALPTAMFAVNQGQFDKSWCHDFTVLSFGASYKNLYEVWDQWLEKFERLLSQMFWFEAKAHYEGMPKDFVAHWQADQSCIDAYFAGEQNVIAKWQFNDAPRAFPGLIL